MTIQYCSDLHLEFSANWKWLQTNPIIPSGDILLVAGDTFHLGENFSEHPWFDYASKNWRHVFLIPGNHEFYSGFDAKICLESEYELKIRKNVTILNNAVRELNGVRFIFTALWSKIEREVAAVFLGLYDFRVIRIEDEPLTVDHFNAFFDYSWRFLKSELTKKSDKAKVVVTHHLPSIECNLPIYQNTKLNEGFCTDLTAEILHSDVHSWIYGHSHGNKPNFKIGETNLLTNQLGYVQIRGAKSFVRDLCFTI